MRAGLWRVGMAAVGLVLLAQEPRPVARGLQVQPVEASTRGQRVALVIGNGAYGVSPLRNAVNDARGMAEALARCGFEVIRLENAGRTEMFTALRTFGTRLRQGGVGLFYFAGHGMQVKGRNFLIPVGADITGEDEVAAQALEVDLVLAKMESAGNRMNLLILDACRNNPFGAKQRSGASGLAQMEAPEGTYIAFATAPGRTAADGSGDHGLFTGQLLVHLPQPGLKLEDVFKRVRSGVLKASGGGQMPWDSSALTGDFCFVGPAEDVPVAHPAPAPIPAPVPGPMVSRSEAETLHAQGLALYFGQGGTQDLGDALVTLQRAADRGHAEAQARVASMYLQGLGAPRSTSRALAYAQQSAAKGHPWGKYLLGLLLLDKEPAAGLARDVRQGLMLLEESAEAGHDLALYQLARRYRLGLDVPKDADRSAAYFARVLERLRQGAEGGDPECQRRLGQRLQEPGPQADETQATYWLKKAMAAGDPFAPGVLGWRYLSGGTQGRQEALALEAFRRGAQLGEVQALRGLGHMLLNGLGTARDDAKAAECLRRAAELGHPMAQGSYGWMLEVGRGVAKDEAKAATWYRLAASQGDPGGQNNLGVLYRDGRGVAKDDVAAVNLFRQAAEQGHALGQVNLGFMVEHGRGIALDPVQAAAWYRKGAEQGNPIGQANLAICYEKGFGLPKDLEQARLWFGKAASQGSEAGKQGLARLK